MMKTINISQHVHNYVGNTYVSVGHTHKFNNVTSTSPNVKGHYHKYYTLTSIDNNHYHVMEGRTQPAVYLSDGRHQHEINATTSVDGSTPHSHDYYQISGKDYPFRDSIIKS
ncbi:YmaF family protein [Mycoplasmatota bacterium WC44]